MSVVVALRKESVDRNTLAENPMISVDEVALRKESVDRNNAMEIVIIVMHASLSARRAWIEILIILYAFIGVLRRSPQGERG